MYSSESMDVILQRMLDRVPSGIDKREGSIIYDALAPAAAELAQLYMELELNDSLSFADTATGEYLTRIASQFGVNRRAATYAKRAALFYGAGDSPMAVVSGSRFAKDRLVYIVGQEMGTGEYMVTCEQEGSIGNERFGELLPLQYVEGLARAELGEVLVPGVDEEGDEALRQRYYAAVNEPAFGGNVAQYKAILNDMDGVGASKIYPVWNGGGTVKAAIISGDWREPSSTLLSEVQTKLDPSGSSGEGLGLAPIGHQVTVAGVSESAVNVETTLTLALGTTVGQVQDEVEEVMAAYMLDIRRTWAEQSQLVVRVAQVDARLLGVEGVEDVNGTALNGAAENMVLGGDEVPVMGTVTLHVQ
ncbi:baseplate J/gp47 family protein [Paenibacillus chungangensis]|uniref:Baseplate J/gp47 family protein n=1 Tax=Paenibacillus chungangensis TaxID=696535 RepID=A0ABW3HQP0_9BACL